LRKGLTIYVGFFIIMIVFAEFILPWLTESTLKACLTNSLTAHDVSVRLSSAPRFLVALGDIDRIEADAYRADWGDISVSELHLTGTEVKLDMPNLIKNGDVHFTSANELKLIGVITADDLRRTIEDKLTMLEDVQTNITPNLITATAKLTIFGRVAEVELKGLVALDRGSLSFRMTDLSVRNVLPGTLDMSSMFGNFDLIDKDALILGSRFTAVEMSDGKVTITAER